MLSAMSDLFISLAGTDLKADQVNLYDFSGYVLEAGHLNYSQKRTDSQRMSGSKRPVNWREKKYLTPPTVPENIQNQPPMTSGLFPVPIL